MVELNTVSFSFVIRIHCCPVKIFLMMRFPACGRQVSLHFITLPMTASFLGTLTFQSQRYYVGLWKVQLPILSFIHYSHSKKWVKSQNDNEIGLERLLAGSGVGLSKVQHNIFDFAKSKSLKKMLSLAAK